MSISPIRCSTTVSGLTLSGYDEQVRRICSEPYQFYKVIQENRKAQVNDQSFDYTLTWLAVCPCKKMASALRKQLENQSIELLKKEHPHRDPITIVSIGTGGAYQELVYLAKLAQNGFKKIKLIM